MFTLDNYTDMYKYRDTVVSAVANATPDTFTFSNPTNGATIKYNEGTIDIEFDAKPQDSDHDKVTTSIHIYSINGTGTDTTISTTGNLGEIILQAKKLKPGAYKIEGTATDGILTTNATNSLTFSVIEDTGAEDLMKANEHLQVYPNPVGNSATVRYLLDEKSIVLLSITDASGKIIQQLVDATQLKGEYILPLKVPHLANGTYILKLSLKNTAGNNYQENLRVVLSK